MPKVLAPLNLPAVENESGDVLTSSGTLLSKRTAAEILADIGAAAASHNHSISEVTGLQSALDGKAASSHSHAIANITGLQSALDGKAASSHTHSIGNVTGLQSALDGKANLTGGNTFTGVQSFTHSLSIVGGSQYSLTVGGTAANVIRKNNNTGSLTVTGGGTAVTGARVLLYGGDHTYSPNIGWLSAGSSHVLTWNPSGVSVTGAFKVNDNDVLTSLPPHSHAIGEVTGLQNALDGKAATSHNHNLDSLSNVTITSNTNGEILRWNGSAWINNTLSEAGIAAASHTHTIANVTGLQGALDDKADDVHTHAAGDITSGRLSAARLPTSATANRVLKVGTANSNPTYGQVAWGELTGVPGTFPPATHNHNDLYYTETEVDTLLSGKANTSHTHTIANVTGLQSALDGKANTSHVHAAGDVTSGTFAIARIPTGTTSSTVSLGNHSHTPASIGAAAASHTHSAGDINSGTLAVNRGGTGISSYTANNYIRASGSTTLQQRTPAQVRGDIGAAAASHTHAVSDVTSLQTSLDGKANLTGGNTFTGDQTLSGASSRLLLPNNYSTAPSIAFASDPITGISNGMAYSQIWFITAGNSVGRFHTTGMNVYGTLNANSLTLNRNNNPIRIRNADDTGWVNTINVGSSNVVTVGDTGEQLAVRGTDISANQYLMTTTNNRVITVPRPFGEKEAFMLNPLENGEYYIVMNEATTINIPGAVTRGTGSAAYARSTNGTSFSTITGSTGFNANDVLRVTVSGMSAENYFSVSIPQSGGGYSYEPLVFNPAENGEYFVTMDSAKSYDLGSVVSRGTGSVAFARSSTGSNFTTVTGNTTFQANYVLRATVSGMSSGYYAFTIPRTA